MEGHQCPKCGGGVDQIRTTSVYADSYHCSKRCGWHHVHPTDARIAHLEAEVERLRGERDAVICKVCGCGVELCECKVIFLRALLRESKRRCYVDLDSSLGCRDLEEQECWCGAAAWNARVDAALGEAELRALKAESQSAAHATDQPVSPPAPEPER
jgi:hypothetical protein